MRVYRLLGERYAQCHIAETVAYGGGCVIVWGDITSEARMEFVIVDRGCVTDPRYIADILEPHVVLFAPVIGQNFIFIHDNARPLTLHEWCVSIFKKLELSQ